jgi:PAS domain S-box-containing protein
METASDLMQITDKDGYFTYVNKSTARTLGYSEKKMIGMHITQILSKKILEKNFEPGWEELILKGEASPESILLTKNKKEIYGEVKVVAIYDSENKYAGCRGVFRDTTEHKKMEKALKKREKELEVKASNLEEVNTALRVLLKRRDEDKIELEEKVLLNIKAIVIPYLERLKNSRLDERQKVYTSILESNLNDIISPFSRTMIIKYANLSPREIQVANLVKNNKSSKEIGNLLNLSTRTIEAYRYRLRNKIGIEQKKVNLRTYLLSL